MAKKNDKTERKIVRISENAKPQKMMDMAEEVRHGRAKLLCYAVDNNIGYFHYEIIKQ